MRWRGSVAVGKRGDLVGWWAMGVAVVVHAVLLLGLRVEHEEAGGWVARQPLIWETQRQRLGIEKGVGEGIGWMRGRFSGDVPVVGKFSRKIEEFVGRVGEVAVGGSVVLYERGRVGERGGETTKKGRGLVWHVEVGDGLPLELKRILRQHDGDVVASNYTPVRPVVMEVAVGNGGRKGKVSVVQSSGDRELDDAARKVVERVLMRIRVTGGSPFDVVGDRGGRRGRVVLTLEPAE